jgi:uncharacterized protein YndB with AHSA1/START domain
MASTFTVSRSRLIDTPVERVYPLLSDFRQWPRWSPWEDLDPEMHRAYAGAESGVGSVYAWSGNRKAGSGRMEILRTEGNRLVEVALDFEKPFASRNVTTFRLEPVGATTQVTWTMTGPRPLVLRLTRKFFDMDKLVGKDFEKGLAKMALVAPPPDA